VLEEARFAGASSRAIFVRAERVLPAREAPARWLPRLEVPRADDERLPPRRLVLDCERVLVERRPVPRLLLRLEAERELPVRDDEPARLEVLRPRELDALRLPVLRLREVEPPRVEAPRAEERRDDPLVAERRELPDAVLRALAVRREPAPEDAEERRAPAEEEPLRDPRDAELRRERLEPEEPRDDPLLVERRERPKADAVARPELRREAPAAVSRDTSLLKLLC
jgi:hypothetical protein